MSYTTNSTANRLKINKGWKNPSFPEILPLYSRDNVFFFKLYLFLKAYFTLNRTKLIYCDLRNSENYTKILYLVINSVPKKFKKKKSFRTWYVRKTPSGLKYSKFRDANLRHAVNLLYLDLPKLKKQVSAKLLPLAKQKVNNVFYTKTRYRTWINFLAKIKNVRSQNKFKRTTLRFNPTPFKKLNFKQSLKFKVKRLKHEIIVLNRFFTTLKTKNALTKQNIILYKTQLAKLKAKFSKLNSAIANFNKNAITLYNKDKKGSRKFVLATNKIAVNKIASIKTSVYKNQYKQKASKALSKTKLRARLNKTNQIINSVNKISLFDYKNTVRNKFVSRLKKAQFLLKIKERINTRFLFNSLSSISLISDENSKLKPTILSNKAHKQFVHNVITAYTSYLKETNSINNFRTLAKYITLLKAQNFYGITTKINWNYKNFNFSKKNANNIFATLKKIAVLNYPLTLTKANSVHVKRSKRGNRNKFRFAFIKKLRFKKKLNTETRTFSKKAYKLSVNTKNVSVLIKDFAKNYRKLDAKLNNKPNTSKQVWKLRESFRNNYKTHATTLMKYQYKLGLQKMLYNYFKMDFEVKVVRPLSQFKNLNLLRLVYPLRHFNKKSATQELIFKKTLRKFSLKKKSIIPLRERYILLGNRTKRFSPSNSIETQLKNTYVFQKTPNVFKRMRRKELLYFTQSRLSEVRKTLLIRSFMPIASLFVKYLNPQLLADHIAQEFEKTKHHQVIIYGLSQALRSLPFARGKGYRIAISGRINSSDKSRSYLLKRNVLIRQDFSRKVNFATSQARARIGSFGIKVWIFY